MSADKDLVKRLDVLCRAAVFDRDGYKCLHCGKRAHLQWCHVYSRRYRSLRWDLRNCMTLCAGCHLWWHHRPADAVAWWESARPADASAIRIRAQSRERQRVDLAAMEIYLEALCS